MLAEHTTTTWSRGHRHSVSSLLDFSLFPKSSCRGVGVIGISTTIDVGEPDRTREVARFENPDVYLIELGKIEYLRDPILNRVFYTSGRVDYSIISHSDVVTVRKLW